MSCDLTAWTEFLKALYPYLLLPLAAQAIRAYSAYLRALGTLDAPPKRNGVNGSGE